MASTKLRPPFHRPGLHLESLEDRRLLTCELPGFASALRQQLGRLQGPLDGMMASYQQIPLVDNALTGLQQLKSFTDSRLAAITTALSSVDPLNGPAVHGALYGALGPGGLGLLSAPAQLTVAPNMAECSVLVDFNFDQVVANATLPATQAFGIGLDAVPLEIMTHGGVNIGLTFQEHVAFTFTASGSQLVADSMSLAAHATLIPNTSFEAVIGFLPVMIRDQGTTQQPTRFQATFNAANVLASPSFSFQGTADLYLDASARIASDGSSLDFPGVSTDVVVHWSYDSANPSANPPSVEFNNVTLDTGTALSELFGPIVETIKASTLPLQPIVDIVKYPIPGLSDLSHAIGQGDVSLQGIIDAANAGGAFGGYGKLVTLISTLVDITAAIQGIDAADGLNLNLGSFDLGNNADLRTLPAALSITLNPLAFGNLTMLVPRGINGSYDIPAVIQSLEGQLDAIIADANSSTGLKMSAEKAKAFLARWGNGTELKFPILDNPMGVIFPMLLGQDRNLIEFRAQFVADASMQADFGFGPAGVTVAGSVRIDGLLQVGYDTMGIRKLLFDPSHSPSHLADGFHIDNQTHLDLTGSYNAIVYVPIPLPFVQVGGSGGLSIGGANGAGFRVSDPTPGDGKVRFNEIDPVCLFTTRGALSAHLGLFFRVGTELPLVGFVGLEKEFELANVTILDLGSGCVGFNAEPPPEGIAGDPATGLGQVSADGTLTLFMGPHASLRTGTATDSEINEEYTIEHISGDPNGLTGEKVRVKAFGIEQEVDGVRRILGFGAAGQDLVTIDTGVLAPVELHGGDGDDRLIQKGSGAAMMFGDGGQDSLTGGPGVDVLSGGDDNDFLFGNGGNDALQGDQGNDQAYGGPDADQLFGSEGDDELVGGTGDDTLTGGIGDDRLYAEQGNNHLFGNEGNDRLIAHDGRDFLFGGPGDDVISAGPGNDEVYGEAGIDGLFGEAGDDLIDGGTEQDRVEGGLGNDTVRGDAGDDFLFGNEDRDIIDGGLGNDTIDAGDGNNDIFGQAGLDSILAGPGNDLVDGGPDADSVSTGPGADTVHGQAGDDVIDAGDGDNQVYGGPDHDTITTGTGVDLVDGGDGNDSIATGPGNDTVYGQAGTDTIYAGADHDCVEGNDDNDTIYAEAGVDIAIGGNGDDLIEGGSDDDTLIGDVGVVTTTVVLSSGIGRDILRGQAGDDRIHGQGGDDTLEGGDGQDTIFGHDGIDAISGGSERDYLIGGAGNDSIQGNEADDLIDGGTGNDLIEGGLGSDRIYGNDGNDTIHVFAALGTSDNAPEWVSGDAGNDLIFGSGGQDRLDGGAGIDILHGMAGNDRLVAGTGVGDELYGGDGDDHLQGSDEGADTDPDFNDTVRFGDVIDGGIGVDTIHGLGGADSIRGGDGDDWVNSGAGGDRVRAGIGDDYVYAGRGTGDTIDGEAGDDRVYGSHEGNDQVTGGPGRDQLYGQGGNDFLAGADDDDLLDGGAGTDVIFGGVGNDNLLAGGGVGDSLDGGLGSDVLDGSDDGADSLLGGDGRDTIYGRGGNDTIVGGLGDDLIDGGAGDDTISGDEGSDLIVGGAHHDTLYGQSLLGTGDDDAVDYLYGDLGTNRDEVGSGRDRLFGNGGNDVLFAEADDDFIDAGGGTSNIVNYGNGDGATPPNFVPPAPTPPPALQTGVGITLAGATLPSLTDTRGIWSELGGGDSGISQSPAAGIEPSIAIDDAGNRYVAWVDARHGNFEIYVARHVPSVGWQSLPTLNATSATEGGVSDTTGSSRRPSLAIDADGNPVVAWTEYTGFASDIRVAKFDPAAAGGQGAWMALGTSLGASGISGTGTADSSILVSTTTGPAVTWLNNVAGTTEIRVLRFNGASWAAVGTPVVASLLNSSFSPHTSLMSFTADGTKLALAWTQPVGNGSQIYAKEFAGTAWNALGSSASGGGISNLTWDNQTPSATYHNGQLFVAWQSTTQQRPEIHARRFDGMQWQLAGGSADFGVSNTMGSASQPHLASRGGKISLVWADDGRARFDAGTVSVFAMKWDGSQFMPDFQRELRDPGIGASVTVESLTLALDTTGRPMVSWSELGAHAPQVFVRGNFYDVAGNRYQAGPAQSVQAILDANDLNPGDVIEVVGNSPGFTLAAQQDSGVMIVGTPGATITGPVTLNSVSDVTLQGLRVDNQLTINGGARNSLLQSSVLGIWSTGSTDLHIVDNHLECDGVTLDGAVRPIVERNTVSASLTGVVFSGAASTNVLVRQNTIMATDGIQILVGSDGTIANNDVSAAATGLDIHNAFTGSIRENEFHGAATGIRYTAAVTLDANRIHHNTTGILSTVSNTAAALGFVTPSARPNEIRDNTTGVQLTGVMQGQYVHDNVTGVAGSGSLVASDVDHANRIEFNQVGVDFNGPVQFNRIGSNITGLKAQTGQLIAHNSLYRNTDAGIQVTGTTDVRVTNNTLYSPTGDLIRIEGNSRDVQLTNNVFWAEAGTAIHVANDSQQGFWSDYNLLHTGDTGKIVHWSNFYFTDVLDWQADVAQFDLHSRGRTVVHPTWSEPLFVNRADDDYRLPNQSAGQRRSSPAVDAANPLSDLALAATHPANLLANPSFESGVTGWNVNPGGTSATGPIPVFDGTHYFASGSVAAGFAEQTVDLLGNGFTTAQLDSLDYVATVGGRIRTVAESPRDAGSITIKFINGSDQLINQVTTSPSAESDRWAVIGDRVRIPVGTRQIGFRFDSVRLTGTTDDAALDYAFLRVHADRMAPDIGAAGNTYLDTFSTGSAQIALRAPDLYTDWERGESNSIRWETYGNTSNLPVRIDLYQETPQGPAFLTTIAASTADDGEFTWAPQDNSIASPTHGLRIHVQVVGDDIVLDRGTEPFTVPENTTTFFVNDRVSDNDQHTTAIGSNRNTGKRENAPKPYPNSVLRAYALGPTHSLTVDTGDYPLFQPMLVANVAGLGDDEGFSVTGPTLNGRTAILRHANPGYTTAPIMELLDADAMTMSYLTTEGGTNGLWFHGGSEQFTGRHLTLNHASSHGLLLETSVPNSTLDSITSHANGSYGIFVNGPLTHLFDSDIGFNVGGGVLLSNPGNVLVEANFVHENLGRGIEVVSGLPTIGNTNLALGRGNRVISNAGTGISVINVPATIAGNTVMGHRGAFVSGINSAGTITHNVVNDNTTGISSGTTIVGNRVYNNTTGISAGATMTTNVVYSNTTGIDLLGFSSNASNNLVYANLAYGVRVRNNNIQLINNTIYAQSGSAIDLGTIYSNLTLRNNIVWADGPAAVGIVVPPTSQTGFASDYNVWHTTAGGKVGQWQGIDRATFAAWQSAAFTDSNSLAQDPRFVDLDGADGILGYTPTSTGFDDDFHARSQFGSYHGGSLAPILNGSNRLPIFPTATFTVDAQQSPTIDRGAAGDSFSHEPVPSGGFINLGSYGNTNQASHSPAQYVTVTRPDGGEIWPAGQAFSIRWRSHDLVGNGRIELLDSAGAVASTIAVTTANDGEFTWSIPAGLTPGNYAIRVTRLDAGMQSDVSNGLFSLPTPVSVYFVNDATVQAGDWTTAAGNDANDGRSPGAPIANLQNLLDRYDFGPGDTIRIDAGTYNLSTNIQIAADDSGVVIEGYHDAAFPARVATINRGNTASGSYAIQFTGADDVVLSGLTIIGGQRGVTAVAGADSDRITVRDSDIYNHAQAGVYFDIGSEAQQVTGNRIHDLTSAWGVYLVATSGATVNNNTIYNLPNGTGIDIRSVFGQTATNSVTGNEIYATGIGILGSSFVGNYSPIIVQGNHVHDNTNYGIGNINSNVAIVGNSVHHHTLRGISGNDVRDNEVYDNGTGIDTTSTGVARGNRVYQNSIGVSAWGTSLVEANTVYTNTTGMDVFSGSVLVRQNLIYENSIVGVKVRGSNGARLENNTVFQLGTANAVGVESSSSNIALWNNILSVTGGYAYDVANDSQIGFQSNYNTLYASGSGKLARWQGRDFAGLADLFHDLGLDQYSLTANPQFANPAGADGVLGHLNGLDDDFHVTTASPTIDAGNPSDAFTGEPNPNGGRINQGHTGNRADATVSPAQFTQVVSPFGTEKLEHNQQLDIRWRTVGIPEPGGTYIDTVLAQSPVAYYRLGEGSGTTATDSSGNGRHGTYANVGNGLTLGVSGSMAAESDTAIWVTSPGSASVPDSAALRPTQITLEAWVNPDLTITSNASALMKTTSSSWGDGYGLNWQSDKLRFFVNNYNGAGKVEATVTKGQWSHVVGTYDGTALKIYVNGSQAAATSYSTAVSHTMQPLLIGAAQGGFNWKGKLDEVAIYSTALTPAQVTQHYAKGTRPVHGTADIELLAPGNPTPVSAIAQMTANDGQFTWTIPSSIAEGDYFIRVRANEGIQPSDTSNSSIQIANADVHYYVNDNSLAADVFTTVAGSNAHSGKRRDQPMASLAALLAAYDLDPGDVIHVDAGTYNLVANIRLATPDSGVRIEGPPVAAVSQPLAMLGRGNTSSGNYALQFTGADDVTLDYLAITGGEYGIAADALSQSDRLVVTNSEIYGNSQRGIYLGLGLRDARLENNRIRDNGAYGIYADSLAALTVRGNEVYNHTSTGIQVWTNNHPGDSLLDTNLVHHNALGISANADRHIDVRNNQVYANTSGMYVGGDVLATGNQVYSNDGSHPLAGYGISASRAVVSGNTIYGNDRGIDASESQIRDNRIYNNRDEGIQLSFTNSAERNLVYDNEVGLHIGSNDNLLRNNLVYDNFGGGVWVRSGTNLLLDGNTIYQPTTGDAIQVGGANPVSVFAVFGGTNVAVRNNILSVAQGYGLRVAADSERGLVSDYNLFHAIGTGNWGRWEDQDFNDQADWMFHVGQDQHSLTGDPQFVDVDGPDNILGYQQATGTHGGMDDNFRVLAGSPTVDAGDPLGAFAGEPVPNGGRLNIGSTGNGTAAVTSSPQAAHLLSPNGFEKLEAGLAVPITWMIDGLTTNRAVALINAGGAGTSGWSADAYRSAGQNYSFTTPVNLSGVSNPAPAAAYQTATYGGFGAGNRATYQFPVVDGYYSMRLHFVEPWLFAGQRVFDIKLQGTTVQSNYDIFVAAGGQFRATTLMFNTTAAGGQGILLDLVRPQASGDGGIVSAIELTSVNANGVASPTVDLEYSLNQGTSWLSIATGVGMDQYGRGSYPWTPTAETSGNTALVRMRANHGSQPQDASDSAFLITNGGPFFYVNDNSLTGDVFATAVGDNLASGKRGDQPLASLPALLDAYDLEPGDVVHVDAGTYRHYRNVLLKAQDNGVRILGAGNTATVFNRANVNLNQYVLELAGIDDATIESLSLIGGGQGVHAEGGADSDRVTIIGNAIYNNTASTSYGVYLGQGNDDQRVIGNRIHNNSGSSTSYGVYAAGWRTIVEGNEIFGHVTGIESFTGSINPSHATIIRGNTVHGNSTVGIYGYLNDQIVDNRVYGQAGSGDYGIYGLSSIIRSNTVYGNYDGIRTSGPNGQVAVNRVYNNSHYGVETGSSTLVEGNQVYSNSVGIFASSLTGMIVNNLAYANTNQGIVLQGSDGPSLLNNTIYHPVGDAVRMQSSTRNVKFRNNLVWVDSGYDIHVDASSQTGFVSDRNLLHQSADPNAYVGFWAGASRDSLADWRLATGQDANSVAADPMFIDRDGSDNILGYRTSDGFDGGLDDNFHLISGSPAIDRGDGAVAPTLDRDGNPRVDDPGTANAGVPAGLSFVDLGPHEFQGSSLDVTPPTVVSSVIETILGNPSATRVRVIFSEPLDPIDAITPANYQLREAGPDGQFGDGDDTVYAVLPQYMAGLTLVTLNVNVAGGVLPYGNYQLWISGNTSIHDVSGNKLDGDNDGAPGGDFTGTNSQPRLSEVVSQTVTEGQLLSVAITATDPAGGTTRSFSLEPGAPAGAAIHPTTGDLTWTPSEAQGPGGFMISVRVTDNGVPVMSDVKTFQVTVGEENTAPVIAPIGNRSVSELSVLSVQVVATDSDLPVNQLAYGLQAGSPTGAAIDSLTGLFTWTPTEAQGPGEYDIAVVVSDNGSPTAMATQTFHVSVGEVNTAPTLPFIPDKTVEQGQLLLFQVAAIDADLPANDLLFTLEPGAPMGAAMDPQAGIFTWRPGTTVAPGNYPITVRVSDQGQPPLFALRTFIVIVQPAPVPDGDFNDDGLYNALDIDALVGVIAAATHDPSYDLTSDGLVNLTDRDAWLAEAGDANLGAGRVYRLGDATLDGVVDGSDFLRWNAHKFTVVAAWSKGNFDADGVVDGSDFVIWNSNKFTSSDMWLHKTPDSVTPSRGSRERGSSWLRRSTTRPA